MISQESLIVSHYDVLCPPLVNLFRIQIADICYLFVGLALSPDKQYAAISSMVPEGAGAVYIIDISAEDPISWSDPKMVNITGLSGVTNPDAPHPASISINEENKAVVSLPKNNAFVMIDVESASVIESVTQGSVDLTNVDLTDNGIIDQSDSTSVLREADGVAWIGTDYFASANKGGTMMIAHYDLMIFSRISKLTSRPLFHVFLNASI